MGEAQGTHTVMPASGAGTRRRRRWPWVIGIVLVVALAFGAWLAIGLTATARQARAEAVVAQESLVAAGEALQEGDVPAARVAVSRGETAVAAASAALESPQVSVVGAMPVVGQAVADARALTAAAGHATEAAGQLTTAYAAASGAGGQPPLFADGAIDEESLATVLAAVTAAESQVRQAQAELRRVEATLPGTAPLAEARDAAGGELAGLQASLAPVAAAAPALPAALGFDGPRTYLLGILNSAELRASGGPPLAAAVLRFDDGRLTVIERGQTGDVLIPGHPKVDYVGSDGTPRRDRFINATADADFRNAGIDLARSWEASGKVPVDGVITMDAVALKALLDATGPVETAGYGRLDGDSFIQAVLIDAYDRFAGQQDDRQDLNTLMIDQLTERLTSGEGALDVLRALGATAPSRNVQAWFADPSLQEVVAATALGGGVADPDPNADRIAVFSQNTNASKVDVFQKRTITSDVQLGADGAATVREQIKILNDTPATRRSDKRSYYRTGWSRNTYRIYVADEAQDVDVSLPAGTEGRVASTSSTDTRGRRYATVDAWIPPRETLEISVGYSLAPGTFTGADGHLEYSLLADPQALVREAALAVTVHAPTGMAITHAADPVAGATAEGDTAGWSGDFDQPLRLEFRIS